MATTATDLTNGQIAMVAAARYTQERVAVCPQLFTKMMLDAGEKSKYIPKFASGGAAINLTDGVDMTQETSLSISGSTFTTSEAGAKVIITKKLRSQLKEDAYAAGGRIIGNMMGRKIDQDGVALFSGANSSLGIAGTVLTLGLIGAAVAQMQGQSEPVPTPYVGVFHPYQLSAIIDQLTTANTTNFGQSPMYQQTDSILRDYWRGAEKLYGTNIYADGNITSGSVCYGAIFSPMAFTYLVGWEPETWVEEDKSLRGWEIGIVADYNMIDTDGSYARTMLATGVAPTN